MTSVHASWAHAVAAPGLFDATAQGLVAFAGADALASVDRRLAHFFEQRIRDASPHGVEYVALWTAAGDATVGGKRLRPALVIGAWRHLGGEADGGAAGLENAVILASAFELLHTAFLLHDDVIDGDTMRRGRPNLQGAFSARALKRGVAADRASSWGDAAAVLAGDLLLHAAQRMLAGLDIDALRREALLDLLDESVFVTAAGELFDVAFGIGVTPAALGDVLGMTERKTADYSFGSPLAAGAILSGATPDAGTVLREFGRLVGTAFQLRDDVLGVFGVEEQTGKSALTDLRRGTLTPLIAFARGTAQWPMISGYLGRELGRQEALLVRQALEDCGARSFVEELINDFCSRAIRVVDSPALPATLGRHLVHVAGAAAERAA